MELELLNLLIVLTAAWIGGAIAVRLGYPSILGELVMGILLGPALFQILEPTETTTVLAEIGVLLMMLYIGMEIDFRDLGKASWPGLLAAMGGFIVPFALGYYTVIGFGGSTMGGLFVAIAVGVTSLATKSRILIDLKLLNTRIANVLMAGALISDTLALIIFAGIISFADAGNIDLVQISLVAGKAILFFVVAGLFGIYVLPYLGKQLERIGFSNRTGFFTLMLIIAVGYAELAELAGLHHILGAFLAGLFLRDSVFNRRLSKELNKVFYDISIGFLAPIFFVTAGYLVTFEVFQTDLLLLLVILAVATFGKIFGTALFYLPSGFGWREGITVGTGMNGRGAVEIIIAGIALRLGYITPELFSILVFMAIFTTATVPVLLTWTTKWLRSRGELVLSDSEKQGILILGANPLSIYIAKHLQAQAEVTMIDANKDLAMAAEQEGLHCINGNALKEETMAEAKAAGVKIFIGLTSNSEINLLAAQLASETFLVPQKYVLVSPGEDGVGIDLLEPIRASTIFAMKTYLNPWIHKISSGQVEEIEETVDAKISTREWVNKWDKDREKVLPILIKDSEGNKRPFQYEDSIEEGEQVIYLK